MSDPVLVEKVEGVARVLLNRPDRRNALNETLVRRLDAVLLDLENADWCRAIVLAGEGKAFCAGGDLDDNIEAGTDAESAANRHRVFLAAARRLERTPKPTVACVHGAAVGAGASLALLCDEVIVGPNAKFGFGFLQVALPPDLLSAETLPRRVGWTVAASLLHTGRLVAGPEAVTLGLANELVEDPVVEAATARAAELGRLAPFAFAATKALLRQARSGRSVEDLEPSLVGTAVMTADFRAATERFRSPARS